MNSKEIVQQAWKVFATRDAAQIAAFFTEDAEWLAPAGNATAVILGIPSHMVGRDAIVRFLAVEFGRLFDDVSVDFRGFYVDGDVVIVEETMTATAAGVPYVNDYCFVFELLGDRIHRVREHMDTARGHRQLAGVNTVR